MPRLIKNRQIVEDQWLLMPEQESEALQERLAEVAGHDLIISLPCWRALQEGTLTLPAGQDARLGIWLDSHELPAQIGAELSTLPVIALNFPSFRDGRPYSSARELRLNLGYQGELRATGDVLRDQLFYMARCGFDAFTPREDQDLEECLSAFDDFHEGYQGSVDQPIPLFRRRAR
jgi:uncharacterized protein (DUF934 family)